MGNQTVLPSTCQYGSKKEAHWSEGEKLLLVEFYSTLKHTIRGKFSAKLSRNDKKGAWDELYEKFSSQNVHGKERSMDELKKKWDNLTMTAKRDYSTWKG